MLGISWQLPCEIARNIAWYLADGAVGRVSVRWGRSTVHALYRPLGLVACFFEHKNMGPHAHLWHQLLFHTKESRLGRWGGGGGGLYRPLGHYHPLYRHEILLKFLVVHQTPSLITGFVYAIGKPLEIAPILKSSYLRTMPTNTEVFLCGLWLCGKSRPLQGLLESKKKIGGNHAVFRDN